MLPKCANEACSTPFRRLREGKLFEVETEYFAGNGPTGEAPRKTRRGAVWSTTGSAVPGPHL